MLIKIRAKSPGVWNVYMSEGLTNNAKVGSITRIGHSPLVTYFYDLDGTRHEIGSYPQNWPSTVKRILGQRIVRNTPEA